jgi:hypothetical protein
LVVANFIVAILAASASGAALVLRVLYGLTGIGLVYFNPNCGQTYLNAKFGFTYLSLLY